MDDFLDEVFDSSDAFGDIDECVYVAPDQNGHVPWGSCRAYYLYYPSQAGNGVFAVLFALATLVLFQQMCHYRKARRPVGGEAGRPLQGDGQADRTSSTPSWPSRRE